MFRTTLVLLFLMVLFTLSARTTPAQSRYFLRLFNCDDGCVAEINGGVISSTGFATDTGWVEITDALMDGTNLIKFTVTNEAAGIAYGFQVRKNQMTVFEEVCGRAGAIGCDNNRIFPKGVVRTFTYEILRPPADRPASYTNWLAFLGEFRAALNSRDRNVLRSMIAIPFDTQEGQLRSFDAVMKFLDRDMLRQLQREIAPGAKFTFSLESAYTDRGRRPTRSSVNGIFYFELGTDGRWRLCCQGENEDLGEQSNESPQRSDEVSNSWEGTYSFEEVVPRGGGNAGNIGYEIVIHRNRNNLIADLNVDGWQTMDRLKCTTQIEGNKIHFYLSGFGEEDFTGKGKYRVGALLLTLQRSTVGGKTGIVTYWGALKPMSRSDAISGRVYFKRET